jgi:D-alanyl-D-alanine carboxypeptidase
MSITDFARFVQMHLRGYQGQDGLLESATIRYLHQPVRTYALGWGVYSLDGHMVSLHNGSAGTFYATMAISHSRDWGL